jgi:hypothetical protein
MRDMRTLTGQRAHVCRPTSGLILMYLHFLYRLYVLVSCDFQNEQHSFSWNEPVGLCKEEAVCFLCDIN